MARCPPSAGACSSASFSVLRSPLFLTGLRCLRCMHRYKRTRTARRLADTGVGAAGLRRYYLLPDQPRGLFLPQGFRTATLRPANHHRSCHSVRENDSRHWVAVPVSRTLSAGATEHQYTRAHSWNDFDNCEPDKAVRTSWMLNTTLRCDPSSRT